MRQLGQEQLFDSFTIQKADNLNITYGNVAFN